MTSDSPVPATDSIVGRFLDLRATDLVDRYPVVRSNAPPVFQFGKTTVTFTATDASGNRSTASGTVEVIKSPAPTSTPVVTPGTTPPDRTPPGNVRSLKITVSGRAALLQWRPPTGDFDHVAILRSGNEKKAVTVYSGTSSKFVDNRLTLGVVYRYLVVAVDKTGNRLTGVAALGRAAAYPLPEAQVDRFMLKVVVDYPSEDEEMTIAQRSLDPAPLLTRVLDIEQLAALQTHTAAVYVDPVVSRYAVNLAGRPAIWRRPACPSGRPTSPSARARAARSACCTPPVRSRSCAAATTCCRRTCASSHPTRCAIGSC